VEGDFVKTYPTDRIRNIALVGHGGAGKTTLAEALLARAGAVARAGRVDDGTSSLDTEPESVTRRMSLAHALAPFEWTASDGNTYKVNLLDTPGYLDFEAEVDAALSVADMAVFVVSALDGVEVQTELLWRKAAARKLPRMIFVNKDDKDRADFRGVLEQLRAAFGNGVTALELPVGEAASLSGVNDALADHDNELHAALVEEIVAGDDEQLERYLSGEEPTAAELERTLAHEVFDCLEFPVLVGSATTGVGIDKLADYLCELGPAPAMSADPSPAVQVFKTLADPFIGQLSLFKVLSGTVTTDEKLLNIATGTEERLHALLSLRGKEQTPVTEVVAGDLAAVAKLSNTRTGDVLGRKGAAAPAAATIAPPTPRYAVAIVPRTQADDDKLGAALARLQAEDAALLVERAEETQQTLLRGAGDTHVNVAIERLSRKFGVNVDTTDVRVAYRETISGRAEAEGKVKKQSGGHGQFAVVNLRVAPLERGAGFQFRDVTVGGSVPRNYISAVQAGIEDAMRHGGVHGFTVVDVAVECFDGKFHPVDSSEMAFKTAAAQGFKSALADAGVVVLEPISLLTVTVPSAQLGDVMSDITARRGRVQGSNPVGDGLQEIGAMVPTAELQRYALDLRSMTSGRGNFTVQHDHYDALPPHLVDAAKRTLPAH